MQNKTRTYHIARGTIFNIVLITYKEKESEKLYIYIYIHIYIYMNHFGGIPWGSSG